MDFLYLELLRQKRALAALLLGIPDDSRNDQQRTDARPSPENPAENSMERLSEARKNPSPSARQYDRIPAAEKTPHSFEAAVSEALGQGGLQVDFDAAASVRRLLSPDASGASPKPWRGMEYPAGLSSSGWREVSRKPTEEFGAASGDGRMSAEPNPLEMARGTGVPSDASASSAMAVLQAGSFTALSTGTDLAAAMSLAFQRDARRYDGGFLSS